MDAEHRLEMRSHRLAEGLRARITGLTESLRPGGRPVYSTRQSEAEALKFWRQHRYDELGQQALTPMKPNQIMALDAWLTGKIEAEAMEPTFG